VGKNKSTVQKKNKTTKFVEIASNNNQGFFMNLLERISGAFSFLQINPVVDESLKIMSFTQIEAKLNKISNPAQQLNFLITSLKEIKVISKSLNVAVQNLTKSFEESKKNCKSRLEGYSDKIDLAQDNIVSNKINIEVHKKRLYIVDAKVDLCKIRNSNLNICNEINDYCDRYQLEYNQEFKELDDLMVFFQSYIQKFN